MQFWKHSTAWKTSHCSCSTQWYKHCQLYLHHCLLHSLNHESNSERLERKSTFVETCSPNISSGGTTNQGLNVGRYRTMESGTPHEIYCRAGILLQIGVDGMKLDCIAGSSSSQRLPESGHRQVNIPCQPSFP